MDSRYSRQIRLTEVGEAGQARIASARFQAAGVDEALYLHRAGAQRVAIAAGAAPEPAVGDAFRFAAARRLGVDAWRALASLRAELRR